MPSNGHPSLKRTEGLYLPANYNPLISWEYVTTFPLRPIHTRGFAPGACSRLILHVSVHTCTRKRFQVRSICAGSLLQNIQPVKYRGAFCEMDILLPRMKYTLEIVGKHGGALLPERPPGAKPLVCIGLYVTWHLTSLMKFERFKRNIRFCLKFCS